jgi:hypothetical protein
MTVGNAQRVGTEVGSGCISEWVGITVSVLGSRELIYAALKKEASAAWFHYNNGRHQLTRGPASDQWIPGCGA